MSDNAHARFDATARVYEYWLCQHKNPFLKDYTSYYFFEAQKKLERVYYETERLVPFSTNR